MRVVVGPQAVVRRSELTEEQVSTLKRRLTIRPRKTGPVQAPDPEPIHMWTEGPGDLFGLPREFYLNLPRNPAHEIEWTTTEGNKENWEPLIAGVQPREEQGPALDVIQREFTENGKTGGMLNAVPGWGKTYFGCLLAQRLQLPTLVMVHKEFLRDQWMESMLGTPHLQPGQPGYRIASVPNAKVGFVQGSQLDYQGKHFVVAMMQTLASRADTLPLDFYNHFGLVIVDECHRIGAATWAPLMSRFPAKYRLGLSATIRRKDGTEAVFAHQLGQILYRAESVRLPVRVRIIETMFQVHPSPRLNPDLISEALLLRFMCAHKGRNSIIVEQILQAVQKGRKCLVLSKRVEHLKVLEEMTRAAWVGPGPGPTTGQYVGGMSKAEYAASVDAQVIFATAQLVQEGFDVPSLDTLFLTTPMSDVEQAVGRIQRDFNGKKDPVVVDFRDPQVKLCVRQAKSRDKLYSKITDSE